mmetsp:Transcript_57249/g.100267  ORF Transcript_57249/g.100267 Transcript_57249/m.100267 type:complete len:173 (-) Transcript_57249:112-630(-)
MGLQRRQQRSETYPEAGSRAGSVDARIEYSEQEADDNWDELFGPLLKPSKPDRSKSMPDMMPGMQRNATGWSQRRSSKTPPNSGKSGDHAKSSPVLGYLDSLEPAIDPIELASDKVHGRWRLRLRKPQWIDRVACRVCQAKYIPLWVLVAIIVEAVLIYGGMHAGQIIHALR